MCGLFSLKIILTFLATIKLENEFEIHFTHYEGSYKPTDFDESDWDTPFSIFKRKLECEHLAPTNNY